MNRGFGSDNHSGIHPEILLAVSNANINHAPSYGTDDWTVSSQKCFQKHFGPQAQVYYVFNGTAANALSLKALAKTYHSVLCSDVSHLNVDECGAPEFFFGGKLIALPSVDGKLSIAALETAMLRGGDQHFSQPKVLSLTQPTELGTVYSMTELKELCDFAKSKHLYIHMDGARISNAAVFLNKSFKEFTTDLGVDVVSFGGTKNGLAFGEAVVFLNPKVAEDFKYIRKQAGQLPSKSRFIAASFEKYLSNDLWKQISTHECQMAENLYQELKSIKGIEITRPRQSNAVFVIIPKAIVKLLRDSGFFFYVWDEKTFECRLMTSWDTQAEDLQQFVTKLRSLL